MEPWKRRAFDEFRLYAVTDMHHADRAALDKIEAAYRGGADIVQLRSKTLKDLELYNLACEVRKISERLQKLFFVNDRLDLAIAAAADGLHIGQDDLPVRKVREICRSLGRDILLGKSTHGLQQAIDTAAEEVDYIGFGPVFSTPTKPDYKPVSESAVPEVLKRVPIPVVLIGGINLSNIESLTKTGANRFAVVRAIFDEGDPYESAKKLCGRIGRVPN